MRASMQINERVEIGKTLPDMDLDFFEFDDDETTKSDEMIYQWKSDEDETDTAGTKSFWESQHHLLQEALSRRCPAEARIQKDTEGIVRNLKPADTICTCLKDCRRNCVLGEIVDRLRGLGYNSALCKSRWRSSPDIPSGEHSYIDAVVEPKSRKKAPVRILIEPNFRAEFEMARANPEYNGLVSTLPEIFVGKSERMRDVIGVMCGAAKRCMRANKMHMAPWRKHKYMKCKWLGPCERIASGVLVPAAAAPCSDHRRPLRPRTSMLTFDLHCASVEPVCAIFQLCSLPP